MVITEIKERIKQIIDPVTDPYYGLIDKKWSSLSKEEKKQISELIRDNIHIIKRFYNLPNREKILDSLEVYAFYNGSIISFPIVYKYFKDIRSLDNLIRSVKDSVFPFHKQYAISIWPKNHYIEIEFNMNAKPKKQKEGLIEVLKIIGEIMTMGYPTCYYGEYKYPIQYYVEKPLNNSIENNNQNHINVRIFIRKDIPNEIVGYLLYKLNNMRLKKSIIPPSGNQYFLIENRIGIKLDYNDPYIEDIIYNILHSFRTHRKIY
jgi:hypothetical protein